MTEKEPGNDEMLPDEYDPAADVAVDEAELEEEEARASAVDPASVADEPGTEYPDPPPPDPEEEHAEYDPTPEAGLD